MRFFDSCPFSYFEPRFLAFHGEFGSFFLNAFMSLLIMLFETEEIPSIDWVTRWIFVSSFIIIYSCSSRKVWVTCSFMDL